MRTKPCRLDDDAIALLTAYQGASTNLSEGVRNMEKKINMLQTVTAFTTSPSQSVTNPIQTVTEPFDWARLEALLKMYSSKSPVEPKVNLFATARTIGKIEPDEMLVEGRKKGEKV